ERSLRRVLQAARRTALHRAGWRTSRQVREIDVDAVATICGARGALGPTQTRAHSTKEKPTSVPMRRDYRLFRSHAVSSAGGSLKPPSEKLDAAPRTFVTRSPDRRSKIPTPRRPPSAARALLRARRSTPYRAPARARRRSAGPAAAAAAARPAESARA